MKKPLTILTKVGFRPPLFIMRSLRSFEIVPFPDKIVGPGGKKMMHRAIRKTARHLNIEHIVFDHYRAYTQREFEMFRLESGSPGRRAALECIAGMLLAGPVISNHAYRMIQLASKANFRGLAAKLLDLARRSIRRTTHGTSKWFARAISDLKPLGFYDPGGWANGLQNVRIRGMKKPESAIRLSKRLPKDMSQFVIVY